MEIELGLNYYECELFQIGRDVNGEKKKNERHLTL